jgi:hypothetical protein
VTLLPQVSAALDAHGVAHAMIGAAALAVHGVIRSTADIDLLVTDARALDTATWASLAATGAHVDVRRGDAADPLAGVVRVTVPGGPTVDVIVGQARWQADAIARGTPATIAGATVRVVTPLDLVLLKLYAGGPQDAWDIDQLLDVVPAVEGDVEAALPVLPSECATLWRRIVRARMP